MLRTRLAAAAVLVVALLMASQTEAQTPGIARVTRRAVIMETPRVDGYVLGVAAPGDTLEILGRQGGWLLVVAPPGSSRPRGWIQAASVQVVGAAPATAGPVKRTMIRGFGEAGWTLFTAKNSFEAILGTASGLMYGGGGQVVFSSGAFVQGSVERLVKTGSRVLVSGTQIFTLPIPDTVTVTPIQLAAGYRDRRYGGTYPYLGVGLGWLTLEEESPSLSQGSQRLRRSHIGYHALGGAEVPIGSWLSLAGEVQWATVTKVLGDTGVSALFQEDDLGGVTFRFKLILGR